MQTLAGNHFVEHEAEGVDVGTMVYWLAFGLLRRHIGCRAQDHAGFGLPHAYRGRIVTLDGRRSAYLGEAEIEHFDCSVRLDLDVAGLQVSVSDPFLVRGVECIGNLP